MAENASFVTIELSRKQVDTSRLIHNEKTDKDYARVFAPGGGNFLYPVGSIKVKSDNPDRVYFSRPEGTEIQVQYSKRKEGVADSAPNEEKYENYSKTWKIEELKAAYDEERRVYAENHGFVNYTVPTAWGRTFESNGANYVSISIPIVNLDTKESVWCSFILPEERFKASEKTEGMSYFGFPKKKQDSTEDYMVNMRYSEKQENGEFVDKNFSMSSTELKGHIDNALAKNEMKDMFVSTTISEKLVRSFESKEGKQLCAISVPVYENGAEKALFYEIVVPQERVKPIENSSQMRISLFRHNTEGEDYTFSARRSFDNGNGGYDSVSKTMTSEEVVVAIDFSRAKYSTNHNQANHSLADEIGTEQTEKTTENSFEEESRATTQNAEQSQMGFRRHSGR